MQKDIEELQSRVAFQEDSLQEMTRTLLDQQRQIDELKTQVEYLHKQLKEMRESEVAISSEETPPHYWLNR